MDEWPDEKKDRIAEMIRSLPLPLEGEALDCGCGNGVLTTILRRASPGDWKVAVSDISSVVIANARSRFPDCEFFTAATAHPSTAGMRRRKSTRRTSFLP